MGGIEDKPPIPEPKHSVFAVWHWHWNTWFLLAVEGLLAWALYLIP